MTSTVAILNTGLVLSGGLSAPAACAAIRSGAVNPTESSVMDSSGEWLMVHRVPIEPQLRGTARLARLATIAITESLALLPEVNRSSIPLLLCVAERDRPGRVEGLDEELFDLIHVETNIGHAAQSLVIPHGRVSICVALNHASRLINEERVPYVLIAASDSVLNWPTLCAYERSNRLLTTNNPDGFIPGEGAGAVLVGSCSVDQPMNCAGLGFATEPAPIKSELPLRGDGLTNAIKSALTDAGCEMHDLDFRITDLSGEQYYFKEATLGLMRTLRSRKEQFDMWHPAQHVGELGAVAGLVMVAVANAACRKGYAPGPSILIHAANDAGQRVAAVLRFNAGPAA